MIFHIADLHLDAHLYGVKRLRESAAVLRHILAKAQELKPDAAIFAGDVYETPSPGVSAQSLWMDFLADMSDICPVLVIAGNHDGASMLGVEKNILENSRIFISSASRLAGGALHPEAPDIFDLNGVGVCALPFIPRSWLMNVAEDPTKALSSLLEKNDGARIACAHLTVSGANLPGKELIPDVPTEFFAKFEYAALGHIHKRQNVGNCHYPGSPLCLSFDECGWPHGFTVLDGKERRMEPVPQSVVMRCFSSANADELVGSVLDLVHSGVPAWVKCVYSGKPRPSLRQELNEACGKSDVRVLALQRGGLAREASPVVDGEMLDELDPREVFDMLLQARKEPPELRGRLRSDFAKLLESLPTGEE